MGKHAQFTKRPMIKQQRYATKTQFYLRKIFRQNGFVYKPVTWFMEDPYNKCMNCRYSLSTQHNTPTIFRIVKLTTYQQTHSGRLGQGQRFNEKSYATITRSFLHTHTVTKCADSTVNISEYIREYLWANLQQAGMV